MVASGVETPFQRTQVLAVWCTYIVTPQRRGGGGPEGGGFQFEIKGPDGAVSLFGRGGVGFGDCPPVAWVGGWGRGALLGVSSLFV